MVRQSSRIKTNPKQSDQSENVSQLEMATSQSPEKKSPEKFPEKSPEKFNYITNAQLEEFLKEQQKQTELTIKNTIKDAIKNEFKSLKEEIVRLQSELESVSGVAENATKLTEMLSKDCMQLKEENTNLKSKLHNIINEQDSLQEIIEDNQNRQLRKTLVFKGIPEQKFRDEQNTNADGSPRMNPESWDDTATILATQISESLEDTTVEQARAMVERCHRGAVNPRYKGNAPRPIFAAFVNWRDSERVKETFHKNNIADRDCGMYAEQKFGPRTTVRRNIAMKERKQLIDTHIIISGYVSHPARLMIKDSRAKGAKYRLWRDYSKEPVKFER